MGKPLIGDEEKQEVLKVLESGWISVGPECKKFEENLANYIGVNRALTLSSCTDGLFLALKALGVGPGDEVIVPTYTFCSSVNVIEHTGAKPILVDSEPNTMNINVAEMEKAITSKTRAIIPVHFAGQPADIDKILKIAGDIPVIEDAAHAIGAEFGNKKIGKFGVATVFSFYATKNMTTGDGGAIVSDDRKLMEKIRTLRLHGLTRDAWKRYGPGGGWRYDIEVAGYKSNMTDIQAALGVIQLRKVNEFNNRRREMAGLYKELLADVDFLELPEERPNRKHVYHLFPVFVKEEVEITRDDLIADLRKVDIGTSVHFIPVHSFTYYKKKYSYKEGDFPVAWEYFSRELSLPMFNGMINEDVKTVVSAIKKIGESHL